MKSKLGYKRNSPDKNKPFNIIPSGRITMKDVDFPVLGIDNTGHQKMMYPDMEYQFPGSEVFEIPMVQLGAENRKESGQKDLSYKWSEPLSKRSLPISYTKVQKGGWLENLPKAQVGLEQKFTSSDVPKNINPNELRPENFINDNEYITYFKNLERYACGFEGCANFANNYAGRVVGLSGKSYQDFLNQGQKTGATGNAWQNYGYTLDLGGKDIFNAYRGSGSIEDVKPGDLIGLQHKNRTVYSGNYDIEGVNAPKAGVKNSHTGVVDYIKTNEDGSKNIYVRHNIGGKAIFDEIQVDSKGNPVIGGGWNVVTAARPNFGNFSPEFTYDESSQEWKLNPYVSDYNVNKSIGLKQKDYNAYADVDESNYLEEQGYESNPILRNINIKKEKARYEKNPGTKEVNLFNENMVRALDSLNKNKKALMDYYKMSDDDFNNLAKQVVATAGVESQFGTSKKEKLKTNNPELVSLAKGDLETVARSLNTKGRKRLERFGKNSLGMFQVKPYSIDPYFIDVFDLGSMKKFSQPEGNVLAAFDHLYRDQKKAKDLASVNTALQTEELKDPSNLSYAVYNTPGRVAAGDITTYPGDPTKYANKKLRRYLEYKKEIPTILNQESDVIIDPTYSNLPEINIVSEKQKGGTNMTNKWLDKLQKGKQVPKGNLVEPGEDFVDISAGKKPWQRIFAEENADISRPLVLGEVPIFASGVTLPNYGDLSQDEIAALQDKGPVGTAAAMKASGRYKDKGSYGESVKNFVTFPKTVADIGSNVLAAGVYTTADLLNNPRKYYNEPSLFSKSVFGDYSKADPSVSQMIPGKYFGIDPETNPLGYTAVNLIGDPSNLAGIAGLSKISIADLKNLERNLSINLLNSKPALKVREEIIKGLTRPVKDENLFTEKNLDRLKNRGFLKSKSGFVIDTYDGTLDKLLNSKDAGKGVLRNYLKDIFKKNYKGTSDFRFNSPDKSFSARVVLPQKVGYTDMPGLLDNFSFFNSSKMSAGRTAKQIYDLADQVPIGWKINPGSLSGDSYPMWMNTLQKKLANDKGKFSISVSPSFDMYNFNMAGRFSPLSQKFNMPLSENLTTELPEDIKKLYDPVFDLMAEKNADVANELRDRIFQLNKDVSGTLQPGSRYYTGNYYYPYLSLKRNYKQGGENRLKKMQTAGQNKYSTVLTNNNLVSKESSGPFLTNLIGSEGDAAAKFHKLATDIYGTVSYPASLMGSVIDASQGQYKDAALGAVPVVGRQASNLRNFTKGASILDFGRDVQDFFRTNKKQDDNDVWAPKYKMGGWLDNLNN